LRRFLWLALLFALIGDVVATLIAPNVIRYWFAPPVQAGANALLNCEGALAWGMDSLIKVQIGFAAGGIVLGLIVSLLLWRRERRKQAEAKTAAPATPAGPAPAGPGKP
jgi:hypothetical protein